MLAHVEKAEARKVVVDQQLLALKLLLDLAQLDDAHAAAVGREFAGRVLFQAGEQVFRGGGGEGCKEFLFEDGEGAFEGFKIPSGSGVGVGCAGIAADGGGQLPQTDGCGSAAFRGDGRGFKGCRGGIEMCGDAIVFEARLARLGGRGGRSAGGGFAELFGGFHYGLCAPGESVDFAHAAFLLAGLVLVKGRVDAAQDSVEWNTGVAPGFDKSPVERGEQQNSSAALLEALLDLGKVIEVVSAWCQEFTNHCINIKDR